MTWKFICLSLFTIPCWLQAGNIHVKQNTPVSSIKNAIGQAMPGDTIFIHAGTYKEGNIIIDKPLYVKGIDWPVLDGEHRHEVISIKADRVTLTGVQVQNSGRASLDDPGGIKIYDSEFVNIVDNKLINNFFGVYLQYSKHCLVKGNLIAGTGTEEQSIGNGIHCWKSDSLQIIANQVEGHRDGIYFEFVTGSIIWRNSSKKNVRYGLHFMFSHNDAYITNYFSENGAGVAVMFTKNVRMFNNVFRDNWGDAAYGLLLKEISDSYIFNNRFLNNTTAIVMEGTNRIIVEKNVFKNNGWGLKIQASCMDNVITENNFIGNTFDVSTNGHLVLNTFKGNYWDKYEGYDLNKDRTGDVPYRPLSLFSVIAEKNPPVMLLFRSFIIMLLDRSEKIIPTLTPDNFIDEKPAMKAIEL